MHRRSTAPRVVRRHAGALSALAALALASPLALGACAGPRQDDASGGDESALIGGAYVKAGQLPSTLRLAGGCTASKVGPRQILLAAHCVFDGGVLEAYAPGARIHLATTTTAPGGAPLAVTVKQTHLSPSWSAACTPDSDCGLTRRSPAERVSDVAIVETVEEIQGVPAAVVDTEPLSPGEPVVVVGAGCEEGVRQPSYLGRALKAGVTRLVDARVLVHPGSHVKAEHVATVAARDLVTPGPAFGGTNGAAVGLCPGDSGGPLYRLRGRGATVVGVNASYTFVGRGGGLPVTNWHARLDDATEIAAWLASLGVSTCRGASCPVSALPVDLPGADGDVAVPLGGAGTHGDGRDVACQAALFDTQSITRATTSALGVPTLCFPVNGMRFERSDDYYYAAVVLCSPRGTSATSPDAFASAMRAAGHDGFQLLRDGLVYGTHYTAACGSYPNLDEQCRALVADHARTGVDVTNALFVPASCETSEPQRLRSGGSEGDIWYAEVSCTLGGRPSADAIARFAEVVGVDGRHMLTYDAATNRVVGATYSPYCATLQM